MVGSRQISKIHDLNSEEGAGNHRTARPRNLTKLSAEMTSERREKWEQQKMWKLWGFSEFEVAIRQIRLLEYNDFTVNEDNP